MAQYRKKTLKGGTVAWLARCRVAGRDRARQFSTLAEAKAWAAEVETEVRKLGKLPAGGPVRFEHAIAAYRAAVPRSPLDIRKLVWWQDRFKGLDLEKVTPREISAAVGALAEGNSPSGKPLGPATRVRFLASLSRFFSYCERDAGLISANPCRKVRRPREPRGRLPNVSSEERARLLSACRAIDSRLADLVTLALATGARQGELLGLRRIDLDLARGVAIAEHTKNHDRRRLHLAGPALEIVRARLEALAPGTVFLFAIPGDSPDRFPDFPRRAWLSACKRAGLAGLRFHDLRHLAASAFLEAGGTLGELRELLGHKTLAMVARYAHLGSTRARQVVELAALATFGSIDPEPIAGPFGGKEAGGGSGAPAVHSAVN